MNDFAQAFNSALSAAGLPPHGSVLVDDKIHRFKTPPDREDNSWYILHQCGEVVVGGFGDWKRGITQVFCSRDRTKMTGEERRTVEQAVRQAKAAQLAEEKANHEKVRRKCADLFAQSPRATQHEYLSKKGIPASSTSVISNHDLYPGWLAIPLQDIDGTVHSAQFIDGNGDKRFFYEGRVRGCFHQFADVNHGGPIVICEGYATGASLHLATHWTTVCAMNCSNLEIVAKDFRRKHPDRTLLIAADNDQFTEGNPGLTHATKASRETNSLLAIPEFSDESLLEKPTDFNDLHRLAGLPEVTRQVQRSFPTLRLLAERKFNPLIEPPPLRSIYELQGKTISTPGNLSSITSSIKTGKSACICAMMSSAFPHPDGADLLSFSSANPNQLAIVHIDSEQSPDDHWHMIDRMLRRVGLDKPPDWFYSYCLSGLDHRTIQTSFFEALRQAAARHGGIHSAFLDGIADLVADVNDAAECNALVATLQGKGIEYQCPFIGVIHFNPGTEKTRGHLGSQFERKSETNLRLDKTNEVTTIWSDKQRRAPIPKGTGPSFQWDDEKQMHVSCDAVPSASTKGGRPSITHQIVSMNTHDFLAACPKEGENRSTISRRLESWLAVQNVDASFDTCRRSIMALVTSGKLKKDPSSGLYFVGTNA